MKNILIKRNEIFTNKFSKKFNKTISNVVYINNTFFILFLKKNDPYFGNVISLDEKGNKKWKIGNGEVKNRNKYRSLFIENKILVVLTDNHLKFAVDYSTGKTIKTIKESNEI